MSRQFDTAPRHSDADLFDVTLVSVQLARALRSTTGISITCTADMRGYGPELSLSVDATMTTVEQRRVLVADLGAVLGVAPEAVLPGIDRELQRLQAHDWRGVHVIALINTRDENVEAAA